MSGRFGPDWLIQCPACMLKIERFAEPGDDGDPVPDQMIDAWNRRPSQIPAVADAQSDYL